jgi:hypothetical protein
LPKLVRRIASTKLANLVARPVHDGSDAQRGPTEHADAAYHKSIVLGYCQTGFACRNLAGA